MVARVIVALLLLAVCLPAGAAELSLQLDQKEIERGRVFIGTLHYRGKSGTGPADLRDWEKAFFVERSNFSAEEHDGLIESSEDIRLYPRRSGELVINAIAHGGVIMEPIPVRVRPLRRNGITGDPSIEPLPAGVQVGSPLAVTVLAPLLAPGNKVRAEPWEAPGFRVEALPSKRIATAAGEAVALRWRLYPLAKGHHRLEPPAVAQKGNGRWRFHLPLQEIAVTPLPSYLPPTLPVGRLAVSSRALRVNDQPFWEVTLHGPGLLDDHPWGLHQALAEATGIGEGAIRLFDERVDADGLRHKRWRLPVPRGHFDLLHGPKITLRYFDPATQRVESITHRLPRGENIPTWLGVLLIIGAIGIGMLIALGVAQLVRPLLQWWRNHQALTRATDPDALRRLLLRQHDCRHLEQWAAGQRSVCATQAAAELNALCFSRNATPDFATVKEKVLRSEAFSRRLQSRIDSALLRARRAVRRLFAFSR